MSNGTDIAEMKNIFHFFDKFEDRMRARLAKRPILYTLIGGIAVVLFWKGVWETADLIPFFSGPLLVVISLTVLLATGLFVSFFIGDRLIISGLKGEKKIAEKTEEEVRSESITLKEIREEIRHLDKDIHEIKEGRKADRS